MTVKCVAVLCCLLVWITPCITLADSPEEREAGPGAPAPDLALDAAGPGVPAPDLDIKAAGPTAPIPSLAQEKPGEGSLDKGRVTIGLDLAECVRRAYTNNITLRKNRQSMDSSATFIYEAQAAFDPEVFTNVTGEERISPNQPFQGIVFEDESETDILHIGSGFRGMVESGAQYTLALNLDRFFDPSYRGTYNPSTGMREGALEFHQPVYSDVGIDITQPLLRGAWTTVNRAQIYQASINTQSEVLSLETSSTQILFNTIQAYWNLKYALEDLAARKYARKLAQELLDINTRKKQEGVFSKMEVLEADVEVAFTNEALITARSAVRQAEDDLKHLIFNFATPKEWEFGIIPLTEPMDLPEIDYDLDGLIEDALVHRADFRSLKLDLESKKLDVITARNSLLPQLDLRGTWSYNGLAGNVGNAIDELSTQDYRSFSVGMEFSYPIGNRAAKNAYKRSKIQHQIALTALKEQEVQIVSEIREAVREVGLQREKLHALNESVVLNQERYDGEKKRLEAGISIPYQVREAERELTNETVKRARARLDYQIALARVAQVQGLLLEENGININHKDLDDWVALGGR